MMRIKTGIVVCGSQRFKHEMEGFSAFMYSKGMPVMTPNFKYHRKRTIHKSEENRLKSDSYRAKVPGLVRDHFDKIAQMQTSSGLVLIFNPLSKDGKRLKFGYIGSNTQGEVAYACALHVPVIMLRPHQEEWIMTVAHKTDNERIFTLSCPNADPLDYDRVWNDWLKKRWIDV